MNDHEELGIKVILMGYGISVGVVLMVAILVWQCLEVFG